MTPKPRLILSRKDIDRISTHVSNMEEGIEDLTALCDFIESEMQRYADMKVREFAEMVRPSTNKDLVVNWNHDFKRGWIRRSEDVSMKIDTLLKELEAK